MESRVQILFSEKFPIDANHQKNHDGQETTKRGSRRFLYVSMLQSLQDLHVAMDRCIARADKLLRGASGNARDAELCSPGTFAIKTAHLLGIVFFGTPHCLYCEHKDGHDTFSRSATHLCRRQQQPGRILCDVTPRSFPVSSKSRIRNCHCLRSNKWQLEHSSTDTLPPTTTTRSSRISSFPS